MSHESAISLLFGYFQFSLHLFVAGCILIKRLSIYGIDLDLRKGHGGRFSSPLQAQPLDMASVALTWTWLPILGFFFSILYLISIWQWPRPLRTSPGWWTGLPPAPTTGQVKPVPPVILFLSSRGSFFIDVPSGHLGGKCLVWEVQHPGFLPATLHLYRIRICHVSQCTRHICMPFMFYHIFSPFG